MFTHTYMLRSLHIEAIDLTENINLQISLFSIPYSLKDNDISNKRNNLIVGKILFRIIC